jgi:hypothetical protein
MYFQRPAVAVVTQLGIFSTVARPHGTSVYYLEQEELFLYSNEKYFLKLLEMPCHAPADNVSDQGKQNGRGQLASFTICQKKGDIGSVFCTAIALENESTTKHQ